MCISLSLAHSYKANLFMLYMETFIRKFPTLNRSCLFYTKYVDSYKLLLTDSGLVYISSLDIHALDDSMEFSAHICQFFSDCVQCLSFAYGEEISNCLGCIFCEKFNYYFLNLSVTPRKVNVKESVIAPRCVFNQGLLSIDCLLLVNERVCIVNVSEFVENPVKEGITISDVDSIVKIDYWRCGLVLIKRTLFLNLKVV